MKSFWDTLTHKIYFLMIKIINFRGETKRVGSSLLVLPSSLATQDDESTDDDEDVDQ